jgi:hypothetical protein
MDYKGLIDNYCNFNTFNIESNDKEDFFKTPTTINSEINLDEEYVRNNSKFNSNYKIPINTTALSDALVTRYGNGDTKFYPELALMFLKTYSKQLLSNSDYNLDPKKLISIFNKNQELVEIPYPLILLLGGLYYFQENESLIGIQEPDNLFGRINGVKPLTNFSSNDVYSVTELYRKPGIYTKNQNTQTIYFPSVRLLNRSLYVDDATNDSTYKKTSFDIKTSVVNDQEVIEKISINNKDIIPSVGYGIQNRFLNYYNKVLFGDFLNGSINTDTNDLKPHVLAGGYSGILKPFKTYDSEVEFTAFYRNLHVGNINYNINDLVSELNSVTTRLKKPKFGNKNTNNALINFIKSFVVFSKLKAAYLSGQFGTKDLFKTAIDSLCKSYNIDSEYNSKLSGDNKLCDFYFLVSHVFFTSYREVSKSSTDPDNIYDIRYRLGYGLVASENYQKSILDDKLMLLLNNKKSTRAEQVDSLTNFLTYIWDIEKINLKNSYSIVDQKAVFALYPSAGGFITPNMLTTPTYYTKDPTQGLSLYGSDRYSNDKVNISNYLYTDNNNITYKKSEGEVGKSLVRYGVMVDTANESRTENFGDPKNNLLNAFKEKQNRNINSNRMDPTLPKYLIDETFSRSNFINNHCFNNHAILRNTTRFLWFENNNSGEHLLLDYNPRKTNDSYFYENVDGVSANLIPEKAENGYLRNITNKIFGKYNTEIYNESGYIDVFNFSRIMDSINVEKLIEFSELFKEFSTLNTNTNSNTFNLNSLIKSSTIIKTSEIFSDGELFQDNKFTDPKLNITLTADEVWLCLIGNSMYNYEFTSNSGLAKFFNIALTSAQKKRCNEVVDQFCSHVVTVANKSTIDSVSKLGDFQLSLHNFHSSPEVLFTNSETYEDMKIKLSDSNNLLFDKLITRRILFADQYIPQYVDLTTAENIEIIELNKMYIYNKYHHLSNDTLNFTYDDYYLNLVKTFFKYLNIRYTKNNYKQLIKLIRGYAYQTSKALNNLNVNLLPNTGVVNFNQFKTFLNIKSNNPQPIGQIEKFVFKQIDLDNAIQKFFYEFNKTTYDSTVSGLNGLLSRLNTNVSDLIKPENQNNNNNPYGDDPIYNFKKTTYYNVKDMFDKISVGTYKQSSSLLNINKLDDLRSIDVGSLKNLNLFYNFKLNSDSCGDIQTVKEDLYDIYQIFQVVDRGNNDIGTKIVPNLAYFYENLYTDFNKSSNNDTRDPNTSLSNLTNATFYKLFSGMAKESGFVLQIIPNYLNLNSAISRMDSDNDTLYEVVDDLFGVHDNTEVFGASFYNKKRNVRFGGVSGLPGFIFQLGSTTSEVNTDDGSKNNNLRSFCLDVGYDNNREVSVKTEDAPDDILKSNITCFTVDFSTKNQQMFNSIQLDTAEFYHTEESIKTWVDVVNNTQQSLQTTNLFPQMEKRSYSCTVSGLGNTTIQPLSYFYLKNVPLFHGTYWITNVSHDIKPNTILTTFKGARQAIVNRNDSRLAIINLMKERSKQIKTTLSDSNVIITTGIPNTTGDVVLISNTNKPYGEVMQQTDDGLKYYRFDGLSIIGAFIFSITKSNETNNANLGLINVLYNQSKAYLGNTLDHSKIIANMKNIAIGIMKQKAVNGDLRYGNGDLSISKLLKENNSFGYLSKLGELLNEIVNINEFKNKTSRLTDNINLFNTSASDNGSSNITNSNKNIKFLSDVPINTNSSTIPLNEATFYVESNDTTYRANSVIDGIGVASDNNSTYFNFFDLYNSLSDNNNGIINKINVEKNVTKNTVNIPVKFLGAIEPNKVSFFATKSNGQFGNINWDNNIRVKYNLNIANNNQLEIEFKNNTTETNPNRDLFVNDLSNLAEIEFKNWGDGSLKESSCGSNQNITSLLRKYWKSYTGKDDFVCGEYWSAVFISYLVKSAAPKPNDFKYSSSHSDYIIDIRDNNRSWKAYRTNDIKNGVLQLGDIICKSRGINNLDLNDFKKNQSAHCDCVTKINNGAKFAEAIGGNVSDSVFKTKLELNDDGTVNSKNGFTVILRFEPTFNNDGNILNNTNDRGESAIGKQKGSIESSLSETEEFLIDVLRGIDIPSPNGSQIQFMKSWRQHEGGMATWNPLNTTQNKINATIYNNHMVKNYPDRQIGLEATIETLKNNRYKNVVDAIKNITNNEDINTAMIAVNNSKWGSNFNPANYKYWLTLNNLIWKPPLVNK